MYRILPFSTWALLSNYLSPPPPVAGSVLFWSTFHSPCDADNHFLASPLHRFPNHRNGCTVMFSLISTTIALVLICSFLFRIEKCSLSLIIAWPELCQEVMNRLRLTNFTDMEMIAVWFSGTSVGEMIADGVLTEGRTLQVNSKNPVYS